MHKGVPWNPLKKTTFPPGFFNYHYTMCIYTNHNHISGKKKIKIYVPFQNGGQITDFHFATFRFRRIKLITRNSQSQVSVTYFWVIFVIWSSHFQHLAYTNKLKIQQHLLQFYHLSKYNLFWNIKGACPILISVKSVKQFWCTKQCCLMQLPTT